VQRRKTYDSHAVNIDLHPAKENKTGLSKISVWFVYRCLIFINNLQ